MTLSSSVLGLKLTGRVPILTVMIPLLGMICMGCSPEDFPDTPLFRDIEGIEYDQGRTLIQQRVARSFPVGSKESGLAEYLKSQGMTVSRNENSGASDLPIYGQASFIKDRGGCDIVVGVDWRADKDSIIRDISVRYSDVGCM
jgi:hypothetical protein